MDHLSRRRLLGFGGASLGAVAGCLDETSGTGSENGSDDPAGDGNGADDSNSSLDGVDPPCPDYGDGVDRVVCYDGVDPDTEPTFLEPSERTVEEGSTIEFTLANGADERLATNFYNWRVDKYVDGEWHRIAPLGYNQPLMHLEPGEHHTWAVTPDNDGITDGERVASTGDTNEITLEGVGPGTYAFRARGWFEGARDEGILAFATTFELEAEELTLTPTDAIAETERERGDDGTETLVARSTRGDPDDEHRRPGAFELEVVDEPDWDGKPRRMITEQLLRFGQLWDAIALANERDASAVRIEERDGTRPIFGRDSDGLYEYRSRCYRVRTRELEE
ncbi:immunoglobulin-like domain-containing protein [Natronococcus wangiae]|uniref:immunoglobulin-like domain-containing protein n=1 Tax=Natronococcus wangiae TaxID=3068275 RepID=UPI00273E6A8D|nr:hypothetical protein [Natronococcus sp. AD5]